MTAPTVHGLPTPVPDSPLLPRRPYQFSTLCVNVESPNDDHRDQHGSSSVPIYQSATFKGLDGQYDYTRSGNPTRTHLEHHIAKISYAKHAFAISSGMAALDVILRRLKPGDEIVTGDDLYGGTNRILKYLQDNAGVVVHHIDPTDPGVILSYVRPGKTAMVLLENPTNPLLKIVDFATICKQTKERAPGVIVVVDNTMMSPYLQRPLDHGADIVYDSATKYLSGHHDLMAGVIVCNRDDLAKEIAFVINAVGNGLSPFDSFLLLRGCKTLAVRMERQQASASKVATVLHQLGFQVNYPGLEHHPNRSVHELIANGPGSVLSFTTGDKTLSQRIVGATRIWGISVSFGCVNSLISMPCIMSHASIDPKTRAARGLPEDLIRLCVGIEDPDDLIDDLKYALFEAGAITLSADREYVRTSFPEALSNAVKKLVLGPIPTSKQQHEGEETEVFVSAPGKVILFGEHAVVYGVTALAASVDLRCYSCATPRNDGRLSVRFPDLDFSHEWSIDDLPWEAVTPVHAGDEHPGEIDQKLIDTITSSFSASGKGDSSGRRAAIAFLYLYMTTASASERSSFTFVSRSTLPIGAGLGSSAAFSVCSATAILLFHKRIRAPSRPLSADQGVIPTDVAKEVNSWAFVSEKILHGKPSGVDNSVAVYGGALAYKRGERGGQMDPVVGFKSLKFLLTDSKVSRDTKKLVAGVLQKKTQDPGFVNDILNKIAGITDEARQLLADPKLPRPMVLSALSALIDENHEYLAKLGVSHPSLEKIKATTQADPFRLSTKLTGAGGGGCAVTLIPDDFDNSRLEKLKEELVSEHFQPYVTSVGGSGLGILSPFTGIPTSNKSPPMTPTESPGGSISPEGTRDAKKGKSSRTSHVFETTNASELGEWVSARGEWVFV